MISLLLHQLQARSRQQGLTAARKRWGAVGDLSLLGWIPGEISTGMCLGSVFFPTCQVRVVRFYVNSRASSFSSFSFSASPPPPRTSTTTSHAQCSLPDLNHDQPRPVFAAGPQPRLATPSVRCRTSTTTIHAQCSLPDLNHDQPRPVFAAGPQPRPSTPSVRCRTSTAGENAKRYAR